MIHHLIIWCIKCRKLLENEKKKFCIFVLNPQVWHFILVKESLVYIIYISFILVKYCQKLSFKTFSCIL